MKSQTKEKLTGRGAFTLVELMVVVGLMAMLGTISIAGYFSAVRGMADRGAMQDTISLIRLAQQVCLIDQTPTAVLFYNRQTQVEGGDVSSEEAQASSVGAAIAIKMAGRISYVYDDIIVDEFADWNQSYPVSGSSSGNSGVRFYRMAELSKVAQGIDKCSSLMNSYVEKVSAGAFRNEYMISAGKQVYNWCSLYKKEGADNQKFSGIAYENGNDCRWGLRFKSQNGVNWKIGDAYGVEIGALELPKGYIFGTKEPNSAKIVSLPALTFSPGDASVSSYEMALNQTVSISAARPDGFKKIGSITANDLKDDAR